MAKAGPNIISRFRAWVAADLWRRSLVTSISLHIVGVIAFSISLPARSRPMAPPIFYVSLMEEPEPAKQTPKPVRESPPKERESPVKIKPEREREQEKPKEKPKEPKPKVETPKEAPEEPQDLSIQTDQPSFEYDYYLETVRRKISSKWRPPAGLGSEEKVVVLHFRILRDGTIQGPAVESASGLDILDRSAKRAVLDAVPLPPLPPAYDGPWLGIHLRFVRHD